MRFAKNLNITSKLLFPPGIVFLFLLGIGVFSLIAFHKQKSLMDQMYNKRFAIYRQSTDLLIMLTRVQGGLYKVLTWSQAGYSNDKINAIIKEQSINLDNSYDLIKSTLERNDLLPEEIEAFERVKGKLPDYKTWALKSMEMSTVDLATASTYMGTANFKFNDIEKDLIFLASYENNSSLKNYNATTRVYSNIILIFSFLLVISFIISIIVVFYISGMIIKPVRKVISDLNQITSGEWDLTMRVPVYSSDEIGIMTRGINVFIEKLQSIMSEILRNANTLSGASSDLSNSVAQIGVNAQEMKTRSNSVASATELSTANVNNISAGAEEMSVSISTVASAIEEMNSSLNEVSRNCQMESQLTSSSDDQAKSANKLMEQLSISVEEIGSVVEVISGIAKQTNLLAINATIEAASAGNAGRGFAIVAHEVKELSGKTAQATKNIKNQIDQMQLNTRNAKKSIESISEIISKINSISCTIMSAVEEQSCTINEISKNTTGASSVATEIAKNVSDSAHNLSEISSSIKQVDHTVTDTTNGIQIINKSAEDMAHLSSELKKMVNQFKI